MATRIEQLINAVETEISLDDSILSLLTGFGDVLRELRAEVASQGFNPVSVDKAIADLTSKQTAMLAAVKAGTELLAPPATPVAEPPVVAGNAPSGPPEMTLAPEAPPPSNTPLPDNNPAPTAAADLPPNKVQADENAGKADEPGPAAPAQADGSGTPLTGDPDQPGSSPDHT